MILLFIQILMSVKKELMDVITTVLILMEAIIVLVWMDMSWIQIIIPVQVRNYVVIKYAYSTFVRTYVCTFILIDYVHTYLDQIIVTISVHAYDCIAIICLKFPFVLIIIKGKSMLIK